MIQLASSHDLDFIYQLYMHPLVNPFLLYEPMDKDSFTPIFQDLMADGVLYVYTDGVTSTPIGMCKIIPLQHRTSHIAYLGGLAIHPQFAGCGHGEKILRDVFEFAQSKNITRIELSAAVHNTKAIALYEKVGFKREGVLRQYAFLASENRYIDEILMSYLAQECALSV